MDSLSETNAARRHRLLKACLLAAGLFAIAVVFFYVAYLGVKTGTAPATTSPPPRVPRSVDAVRIDGLYTREKNPGAFWAVVSYYFAVGLGVAGFGLGVLWDEYKCRRHEKLFLQIRRETQK